VWASSVWTNINHVRGSYGISPILPMGPMGSAGAGANWIY